MTLRPLVTRVAKYVPTPLADEENTHRCRPFLFTTVGGVVAWASGASDVEIFESGIGAINLPLMSGMVGSKATRSSHPRFLRLMSSLLTRASAREITFRLPHLERTKAELMRDLARDGLENVAIQTVSCVHYPLRQLGPKQCGYCPACIFRRQAMISAGIQDPASNYQYDLFGNAVSVSSIESKRFKFLWAFLRQVNQLSELGVGRSIPRFFSRHLIGTRVVARHEPFDFYVDLFGRYRREGLALLADGRARGWFWANLVGPAAVAPPH
jgi:hypothetical protein